jgi:hypothetical protein
MTKTTLIGWSAALILASCGTAPGADLGDGTVDAAAGDPDSAIPDAASPDAGQPPQDAALPDASTGPDCASWCRLELDCRIASIQAEGGVFGSALSCTYPRLDEALAHCVDECSGRGTLPPGITEACLSCESQNFRASCTPSRSWEDCRGTCGDFDLRFIRSALRDELVCAPEGTPATAPTCQASWDSLTVSVSTQTGELDASEPATVTSLDPLRLALASGIEVEVAAQGSWALPVLRVEEAVDVVVKVDCPFWCESSLVVRRSDGALGFATWHGGQAMIPSLRELDLDYVASACTWASSDCTETLAGDLVATPPVGAALQLTPNTAAMLGALTIHHARASRTFEGRCTDTPWEVLSGLVVGPE